MIIHKINFPIYGILILISIIASMLYIYHMIKKDNKYNKNMYLFFFMYISFSLVIGIVFTMITSDGSIIGLSSYGGLIGAILSAFIFEKIISFDNKLIKYVIISLPLVYAVGKLGCFIAGCCHGIPYDGILSVTYVDDMNIPVFPVQLLESIVFFIIFIICNKIRNNSKVIYITIIIAALAKFALDFLRYEHVSKIITLNQIVSIILIISSIVLLIIKRKSK